MLSGCCSFGSLTSTMASTGASPYDARLPEHPELLQLLLLEP
jgi:hypothetical protein